MSDTVSQEVTFDLGDLFSFLWAKKWAIMLTATLFIVLGYMYVQSLPRLYAASSTLLLNEDSNTLPLAGMAALTGSAGSQMDTHIEFIRSRQFLKSIVKAQQLHLTPEFLPPHGPNAGVPDIDHTVSVIQEDLSLSVIADTNMLKVTFVARDPSIAMQVANAIGPAFFDDQASRESGRVASASHWISEQIDTAREMLDASELQLQQFLEANQLVDVGSEMALLQNEIVALMRERLNAEKQLSELSASLEQLQRAEGQPAAMLQVPWVAQNEFVRSLRAQIQRQEVALDELAKRYKPKHYRYVAVQTSLDTLRQELAETVADIRAGLAEQTTSLQSRINALSGQIGQARQKHTDMGNLEVQFTRLRREVELNQQHYDVFLRRLQDAEVLQDLGSQQNFLVVDAARLPQRPVSPRVALSMAVIAVLSVFVSIALWLVIHLLSDKRTRYKQLLKENNIPLLAELPKTNGGAKVASALRIGQARQHHAMDEAIRTLRTGVLLHSEEQQASVLMVSRVKGNTDNGEVTVRLAESFANLEKTLLIEGNLRTPFLHETYADDSLTVGLSDMISRQVRFSRAAFKPHESRLTILPAGTVPDDPMTILRRTRLAALLKKLSTVYQRILVHAPPLNNVSDGLIWARKADAMVLVCDLETTETDELKFAIDTLNDNGLKLLGVVFENV
ncbi:polysaccharide biosynthesis tyrosine autokinase [Alteromonas sp. ASW11-19]|uniref:Polysaccharide biosynthesis tyrosine autokinase n=1 Tax=Alteromonas salexigens TaxID=2982530 RepID=A0ABT2VK61_9ALTE|nr:polysaccharide biosynthesis tyrosine autokinase [Alteromonas salexigens]MCU7553660.1 polysaccharide biosynthesis tyrosine autokinase [Alteromonas salexigens]